MIMRIAWGLGKFAVKHVLVPIAVTAATAVVLQKLADRVDPDHANGKVGGKAASARAPRAAA